MFAKSLDKAPTGLPGGSDVSRVDAPEMARRFEDPEAAGHQADDRLRRGLRHGLWRAFD